MWVDNGQFSKLALDGSISKLHQDIPPHLYLDLSEKCQQFPIFRKPYLFLHTQKMKKNELDKLFFTFFIVVLSVFLRHTLCSYSFSIYYHDLFLFLPLNLLLVSFYGYSMARAEIMTLLQLLQSSFEIIDRPSMQVLTTYVMYLS